MKSRNLKLVKYIITSFLFIVGIFLFNEINVNAASMDLYYPSHAASGYSETGLAKYDENLIVYAHNNGVGKRIDNEKMRIGSVTVNDNTISYGDSEFNNIVNVTKHDGAFSLSGIYGSKQLTTDDASKTGTVDIISINIASLICPDNSSDCLDNDVLNENIQVEIKLEVCNYILFFIPVWEEYTSVNSYISAVKQNSNKIDLAKTSTALANTLSITSISASVDGGNCGETSYTCYNIADLGAEKDVVITINTNFAFVGNLNFEIKNRDNSVKQYSVNYSNNNTITVYDTDVILSSKDITYTLSVSGFVEGTTATDLYGKAIGKINTDVTGNLVVDTVAPEVNNSYFFITKDGKEIKSSIEYKDLGEVYYKFVFSNDTIKAFLTSIAYSFEESGNPINLDKINNEAEFTDDQDKVLTYSEYLSGNGKLIVSAYSITLTDIHGNETKIAYEADEADEEQMSSLYEDSPVTFISSISSVTPAKNYYYAGETIKVTVTTTDTYANILFCFNRECSNYESVSLDSNKNLNYLVASSFIDESIVSKINFYKYQGSTENTVLVYSADVNIHINKYFDLNINNGKITNPIDSKFNLYSIVDENAAIKSFENSFADNLITCDSSDNKNILCNYNGDTNDKDIQLTLAAGTITLENGYKNAEYSFILSINNSTPNVNLEYNNKYVELNDDIYYKNRENLLKFTLNDGNKMCFYYKFVPTNGEPEKFVYNSECDIANDTTLYISVPDKNSEYTIYYYVSDGLNLTAEVTKKYIYRGEFNKESNIQIKVNNITLNDEMYKDGKYIISPSYFKNIEVKYAGVSNNDFFDKMEVYDNQNKLLDSTIINFNQNMYGSITITVKLFDKLENQKEYKIVANIDTTPPSFDNIRSVVTKIDDNLYKVEVYGYEKEDTLTIKVNGNIVPLVNSSFETQEDIYEITLEDYLGNFASKKYTVKSPILQLNELSKTGTSALYELYLVNYIDSYEIEESFKYYVFDYLSDITEKDLNDAKGNRCTEGRTTICYKEGNFPSNDFKTKHTFDKGYSYIIEVTVSGVAANQYGTDKLPRLDIEYADEIGPTGKVEKDVNPEFISSKSGEEFVFKFLATDSFLTQSYYYLIALDGSVTSIEQFNDLYNNCYINATDKKCVANGENLYEQKVDEFTNTYLGEVSVSNNERMKNNETYSLYVVLKDLNNNSTLFLVRSGVKNITEVPVDIKYRDDNKTYQPISNGKEVTTVSSSAITINKLNSDLDVQVKINGEEVDYGSGELELSVGKYVIEVYDELGNYNSVVVYSGIGSKPYINVYYRRTINGSNDVYIKLGENDYSYNNGAIDRVYIKVVGVNLKNVNINLVSTQGISNNLSYDSGTELFDEITSDDNVYGISLSEILTIYGAQEHDGNIVITASNVTDGSSSVVLKLDTIPPSISLKQDSFDLLGKLYNITYDNDGSSIVKLTYQRNITYFLLMKALSLKIEDNYFESMINNARMSFVVNGEKMSDFNQTITKGENIIKIDYFDGAGNESETLTIKLIIIDDEKPNITLVGAITEAEVNTNVSLASVIVTDNHDDYSTLTLSVKIKNGTEIDYQNYLFTEVGEYEIVYTIKDSSLNESTITQNIIVRDTRAPVLEEGTVTEYSVGLNKELIIDLPVFVDSDNSEYEPSEIIILDTNLEIIDSSSFNYPLLVDNDNKKIKFITNIMGVYKIKFIVKDDYNNVTEEIFTVNIIDDTIPTLTIKINDREVANGAISSHVWGSEIKVEAIAIDDFNGDISSRIIKTITKDGIVVSNIDPYMSGDYIIEFNVKDDTNNVVNSSVTIRINKDLNDPVIKEVKVNDVVLVEEEIIKIKGNSLYVEVDAIDDSQDITMKAILNDEIIVNVNQYVSIENDVSGEFYQIKVIVSDMSGNETVKYYTVIVDNKLPEINGISDTVILGDVTISVYDTNIMLVEIYKNGNKLVEYTNNVSSLNLTDVGLYRIVAYDTHGNISNRVFNLIKDMYYEVKNSNGDIIKYEFDYSLLIDTYVEGENIIFSFNNKNNISKKDKIYLLVNYPGEGYKYIAYSMDGSTYLNRNDLSIDYNIISGIDNKDLLEKVGEDYYTYAIVVKDGAESVNNGEEKSNDILGKILIICLFVIGIPLALFVVIKIRRKIRAA